jgi:hypothetical protein
VIILAGGDWHLPHPCSIAGGRCGNDLRSRQRRGTGSDSRNVRLSTPLYTSSALMLTLVLAGTAFSLIPSRVLPRWLGWTAAALVLRSSFPCSASSAVPNEWLPRRVLFLGRARATCMHSERPEFTQVAASRLAPHRFRRLHQIFEQIN